MAQVAREEVSKPYIEQIEENSGAEQTSDSKDKFLLQNTNISIPINYISKYYPKLFNELLIIFSKLNNFINRYPIITNLLFGHI